VGFTLVGLIAGLACIRTQGRYNSWREFAVAEIFGVMGILVSLGFIFYSNVFVLNLPTYDLGFASSEFIIYGISFSVACLILLPLVLAAYNRVVGMFRDNS
jgi:multisubunit Na+/H+ antiporter MnhG subunit